MRHSYYLHFEDEEIKTQSLNSLPTVTRHVKQQSCIQTVTVWLQNSLSHLLSGIGEVNILDHLDPNFSLTLGT